MYNRQTAHIKTVVNCRYSGAAEGVNFCGKRLDFHHPPFTGLMWANNVDARSFRQEHLNE